MTSTPSDPVVAFTPGCLGALRFADWLADTPELRVVRVLPGGVMRELLASVRSDNAATRERVAVEEQVTGAHLSRPASVDVRLADEVSNALEDSTQQARPLVLGRRADARSHALIRLGSVARRVLRH